MYAESLAVNNGSYRQQVKDTGAVLPGICVAVLLLALVVKTVHLSNLSAFVVTTQQGDLVGPSGGKEIQAE
jgi:hypothetical protein